MISSQSVGDYSLVVTRNAVFDTESNNSHRQRPSRCRLRPAARDTYLLCGPIAGCRIRRQRCSRSSASMPPPVAGPWPRPTRYRLDICRRLQPRHGMLWTIIYSHSTPPLLNWPPSTGRRHGDAGRYRRCATGEVDDGTRGCTPSATPRSAPTGRATFARLRQPTGQPSYSALRGLAWPLQPGVRQHWFAVRAIEGIGYLWTVDPATGSRDFHSHPSTALNGVDDWSSSPMARCWLVRRSSPAFHFSGLTPVKLDPALGRLNVIGVTVPYGDRNLTGLEELPGDGLISTGSTCTAGDVLQFGDRPRSGRRPSANLCNTARTR